jgi:hypothetical protein
MTSIILRYNNKTFENVSMNAQPEGAQSVNWSINTFDIVVPPNTLLCSADLLNRHMNVTTYIGADGVTLQESYIYNVSDLQNNTLGTIQYNFNYINTGSGTTTALESLQGTVFVANGVFAAYAGAKVYQTFDNVTGERLITISYYAYTTCGC